MEVVMDVLKEVALFVGIIGGVSVIYSLLTYIKIKSDNKLLNDAIDIVLDAVDNTNQTFVDELKRKGEFNEEAQKEALQKSINDSTKMMSDQVKKYIESNFGDLSVWIESKIESYIKRQKPDSNIPLTAKPLNG